MTAKVTSPTPDSFKRPESVLVVVYTRPGDVLLLQRADSTAAWQSVTGSMRWDESMPIDTAKREVCEETGLTATQGLLENWHQTNRYPIHPLWKPRYHPGQTHNTEHVFSLALETRADISLNPNEHQDFDWCSFTEALERVRFETNRDAIRQLMQKTVDR